MIRQTVIICVLMMLVVASGVATVYVKHLSRLMFVDLQNLERAQDELQIEWGKLQLEQSTWATHDRITTIAGEQLNLFMPPGDSIEVVSLK